MTKEIRNLIRLSMAKDIEIKMLNRAINGVDISREVVLEILNELTDKVEIENL